MIFRNVTKLITLFSLPLILCGWFAGNTHATDVAGTITTNTTWTAVNSPYVLTEGVRVDSGVTLTTEPKVTVKFNTGTALQIDGTLIAQGTGTDKITFTTNTAGDYWG